MKVSKIDLGKNVENRIELFTPNCRKQKSKLGKNVENRFLTVLRGKKNPFKLEYTSPNLI
jgi:hypothetical protein